MNNILEDDELKNIIFLKMLTGEISEITKMYYIIIIIIYIVLYYIRCIL